MDLSQEFCSFVKSYLPNTEFSAQILQGDAGSRIYWRIYTAQQNYILAYNPSPCSNIKLFVRLTEYLRQHNFSAPYIYHQSLDQGLLLLEDFGTNSANNYLSALKIEDRTSIYQLSIDLLIELHKIPAPSFIGEFNSGLMIEELEVFTKYYIPYKFGRALTIDEISNLNSILGQLFIRQKSTKSVLSLQDYHVDNLILLQDETGIRPLRKLANEEQMQGAYGAKKSNVHKVHEDLSTKSAKQLPSVVEFTGWPIKSLGLLDYQDAKNGSPIYDLVSILEDARIEVPREEALKYLRYYADKISSNFEDILTDYHILGLQRNCRILGVFTRKYAQGCNNYLKFLPLVEKYLSYNLLHPVTSEFQKWCTGLSDK